MEIFGFIWNNSTVIAAVLTGILGSLGIKNILGKISSVVGISGKIVVLVEALIWTTIRFLFVATEQAYV